MTVMCFVGCRCLENCDQHVRVESNLTLAAVCRDNCLSSIASGHMFHWKLFIGGTSLADPFTEVLNLESTAIGKYIFVYFIKAKKL